jgi:xanthine dehydrogenase molybdenum-binding subunit
MLNDNLLDYKLMTAIDTPELHAAFVETDDPTGPYGNKALGEPPTIPVAPAIRNAVLNATGVAINAAPLHPQRMFEAFTGAGLIK